MVRSSENTVKIYIEGGGEQDRLKRECRKAFKAFFEKLGFQGRMPRVVACGSRNEAFGDFCSSIRTTSRTGDLPILLVDSEGPVDNAFCNTPLEYLRSREQWDVPSKAANEQVHMMIQCMESWFLADPQALQDFFGSGFRERCLPRMSNLEEISKSDVFNSLKNACRNSHKGEYGKGAHSFKILEKIDAQKVKEAFPSVNRLYQELDNVL